MIAMIEPAPIAGYTSSRLSTMMKMATNARAGGNIWISSSENSPGRRPLKRSREKA